MKLELQEVYLLKEAISAVTIKGSDAHLVSGLLTKLEKEFTRLQKLNEKEVL